MFGITRWHPQRISQSQMCYETIFTSQDPCNFRKGFSSRRTLTGTVFLSISVSCHFCWIAYLLAIFFVKLQLQRSVLKFLIEHFFPQVDNFIVPDYKYCHVTQLCLSPFVELPLPDHDLIKGSIDSISIPIYNTLNLDVLWGQPIKLVHVVPTS